MQRLLLNVCDGRVTLDELVREVNEFDPVVLLRVIADHDRRYGETRSTDWATYYPPTMALLARVLLTGPMDGRRPLPPGSFPRLLRSGNALLDYQPSDLRADTTGSSRTSLALRWAHRSATEGHWRPYYQFARFYYLLRDGGVWQGLKTSNAVDIAGEIAALYGFDHRRIIAVAFALYLASQSGNVRRGEFFSHSDAPDELHPVLDAFLARVMRCAPDYPGIWKSDARSQLAADYPLTAFNPLRKYPLVQDPADPDLLLTPSRFFLMDRMTLGIYYDLVEVHAERKRLRNADGDPSTVQAYNNEMTTFWGGVMEHYARLQLGLLRRTTVVPPFRYGHPGRMLESPDAVLIDNGGVAFIEVKAKTPRLELRATGDLSELEDHLAMGVAAGHVQNLMHLSNLRNGVLKIAGVRPDDPVHLVVICPEPIYWFDLPLVRERFEAAVNRIAAQRSSEFALHYDCTVLGLDDLEVLVPNALMFGGFCRTISRYRDYRRATKGSLIGGSGDWNAPYLLPWFHGELYRKCGHGLSNPILDAEWEKLCEDTETVLRFRQEEE